VSIFIDNGTKLIVQGITGRDGSFHAKQMIEYGTQVVAGVTPGKGGQMFEGTVPIFDTVYDAVQATGANTSVIYVPPMFAADAMMEAAAAGVKLIVCITEGVPVLDMTKVYPYVKEHGARLIGPNCPGLITPGQSKVGIIPGRICMPGNVGVVSRSGTLTYEIVNQLTKAGIGQSSCVGIGGDPINGTNFIDCRVHQGAYEEAGRWLHRRSDRSAGPPHGPRRRDYLRLGRDGRGKNRVVQGGGHGRRPAPG
jgi:succinyl-CoA synthetase alpha subunit